MKILLTGATGFLGGNIARALLAAGHTLVCAARSPAKAQSRLPGATAVHVDFSRATRPQDWISALAGIEVVINAVGILQETSTQSFDVLHHRAPRALFEAARNAKVRRIIQISALGADEQAQSAYHLSKKAADDYLASLPVPGAIVQPSLVYGPGGTSAKMFSAIVRLPVIPLPGKGQQQVQPVYITDLVDGICALVQADPMPTGRIPFVGPVPLSLREFYTRLRMAQGIRSTPRFVPVPMPMVTLGARIGSLIPGLMLDTDTLQMLNRGNTGDPAPLRQLIGRDPRPVEQFGRAGFRRH
nr:complex I NDUFA9 subunit family protein [Pseudomonas sp.]